MILKHMHTVNVNSSFIAIYKSEWMHISLSWFLMFVSGTLSDWEKRHIRLGKGVYIRLYACVHMFLIYLVQNITVSILSPNICIVHLTLTKIT